MLKQPKRQISVDNAADLSSDQIDNLRIAGLFRINQDGTIEKTRQTALFLLNPTSIEESKNSNWTQQNNPGQSDPILQWVSGGPRVLNFQALVTADTSDFVAQAIKPGENLAQKKDNLAKVFSGTIASAFAKVTAPPPKRLTTTPLSSDPLDISDYLNYYRSLLYPIYDNFQNPKSLRGSPPLLAFFSGSSINKYKYGDKISSQHDLWVLTNLRIRITKQLPNLAPMEAEVDFELTQYTIKSFSADRFLAESQ
jgi:hypothetical protein